MKTTLPTDKVIKHSDTKGEEPCIITTLGTALVWFCNSETIKMQSRKSSDSDILMEMLSKWHLSYLLTNHHNYINSRNILFMLQTILTGM